MKNKLESIISGHKVNEDDADWLRAIFHGYEQALESRGVISQQAQEVDAFRDLLWDKNKELEGKDKRIEELEGAITVFRDKRTTGSYHDLFELLSNTEGKV